MGQPTDEQKKLTQNQVKALQREFNPVKKRKCAQAKENDIERMLAAKVDQAIRLLR